MRVDVNLIRAEDRIRRTDEARVAKLAESIAAVGLLNPITVYARDVIRSGVHVPGFGLVAGAHRLEACKRLGWPEIDVQVVTLGEHELVIAECDENLCGANLTPSEVAEFTAARKRAYEALHPETRHGGDRSGASPQVDDLPAKAPRFTADTAAKTGKSEATVQRAASRGEEIIQQALHAVRGTPLDTGAFLDSLKKIAPDKQLAHVERKLAALAAPAPKPSRPAPRSDDEVVEVEVQKFMRLWDKLSPEARDRCLAWVRSDASVGRAA